VVPASSVIVLTSASYLVEVGTSAYAAEFVGARGKLLGVFRRLFMVYPFLWVVLKTEHVSGH
jgi:hypothetical protein